MSNRYLSVRNPFLACSLALLCAIAFAAAPPAQAGFGDLVKKAKDKATKKEEVKEEEAPAGDEQVVFDAYTLELTDKRLAGVVNAYKNASTSPGRREEFVTKVEQANNARNAHFDKYEQEIRNVVNKRDDVEGCLHEGYKKAEERRTKEYADKALTDPRIREKFAKLAAENNAKAMAGDSSAMARLNQGILEEMMPTRADTVAVQVKCGPIPGPIAAEGTLARLDKDVAAANEALRQYDQNVAQSQAETSGMDPGQFATALERIRNYLGYRGNKNWKRSSVRGFSEEEIDALEKQLAEVRAALK